MGRRTFESIGRPLPKRFNVVLSRSKIEIPGVIWASSLEDALFLADVESIRRQRQQFFVIGGENIYRLFAPFINKVFLTEVHDDGLPGDARFDVEFSPLDWDLWRSDSYASTEIDEFPFDMKCFLRKKAVQRLKFKYEFLQSRPDLAKDIGPYIVDMPSSEVSQLHLYDRFVGAA